MKIAVKVRWTGDGGLLKTGKYNRLHQWEFDGGTTIPASSSPDVVPIPYSDPTAVDPEEAFVASISSCHMLWFLSLAAKQGWQISSYQDAAEGFMETCDRITSIQKVILRPELTWEGSRPTKEEIRRLHDEAHERCFIANSVKTKIEIETNLD